MKEDEKIETHESYGQAVFHRLTGSIGRLYGSPIPDSHVTMRLTIRRSEARHSLGRDWHHAYGPDLIEVDFSPAQFAQLISDVGIAAGACCTIRRLDGKVVADPPVDHKLEREKIVESFEAKIQELVKFTRKSWKEAEAILEKKSLTKADKEQLLDIIETVDREIRLNAPFMVEQFDEACEKSVDFARREMEAAKAMILEQMGLLKLAEIKVQSLPEAFGEAQLLPPSKKF